MKRGLVVLLLLAAGVAGAAPLKVGLYADKGCRGSGSALWAWLIDGSPDAELTLLSGEDLRNGGLSGLDLFVNPGGAGGPQTAAMGDEGMAAVRKFVADGGKYLGTCCGFSNLLNEQPSFAKRNTMVPFARIPGGPRGGFTGAVRFTADAVFERGGAGEEEQRGARAGPCHQSDVRRPCGCRLRLRQGPDDPL